MNASWLFGIAVASCAILSTLIKLINALRHKDYSYVKVLLLILSIMILLGVWLFWDFPLSTFPNPSK